MYILTSEAGAFIRAAEVAGMELPAPVRKHVDSLERLTAQIEALPQAGTVPSAAELVAAGTPLAKAGQEHARLVAEHTARAELEATAREALNIARYDVSATVAQERDTLVLALRPIVTGLVEEARPLAEALADFAPRFDDGDLARHASTKQIAAWRKSLELERRFGACMAAWRESYAASTCRGGYESPARVPGFDHRWVDQAHRFWERPELVRNPRLNGTHRGRHGQPVGIEPTVLTVASEPKEAGFRLCTLHELKDVHEARQAARVAEARAVRRPGARAL